jgi:hypothetical protein
MYTFKDLKMNKMVDATTGEIIKEFNPPTPIKTSEIVNDNKVLWTLTIPDEAIGENGEIDISQCEFDDKQ